jgi:hypothetical protein
MELVRGSIYFIFLFDRELGSLQRHQLNRFRHTVRAVKFSGVHHGDWDSEAVISSALPDVKLIDLPFFMHH